MSFPAQILKPTILLVMDRLVLRSILTERFLQHGYRVIEVAERLGALQLGFRHAEIDSVVLDLNSDPTEGVTVARRLQELRPRLQVVLLGVDTLPTCLDAQRSVCLPRPFSTDKLLDSVGLRPVLYEV